MSRKNGRNLLKLWVGMAALLGFVLMPFLICSAAEQPRRGGTLIVGCIKDPTTLNPALTADFNAHRIIDEVFEGLVELDRDLNIRPGLADSWEISPDSLTITFHLAKNVKWHDGKPFTSKDVQFSLMIEYLWRSFSVCRSISIPLSVPFFVDFKADRPRTQWLQSTMKPSFIFLQGSNNPWRDSHRYKACSIDHPISNKKLKELREKRKDSIG